MKTIFLFVAMSLGSSLAAGREFVYFVDGYPADAGDCHGVAESLTQKFKDVSGLSSAEGRCVLVAGDRFSIKITYRAAEALPLVSTMDWRTVRDERGFYQTDEECRKVLAAETEQFVDATHLTPVVAYCYPDHYAAERPFSARIESFGTPALRPFVTNTTVTSIPVGLSGERIEASLLAELKAQGVNVINVRYKNSVAYKTIRSAYYAEARARLDSPQTVQFPTLDECDQVLQKVKSVFSAYEPKPLMIFCAYDDMALTYEVTSLFYNQASLDVALAPERFATREACASTLGNAAYRLQLGASVEWAVCGLMPDLTKRWGISVFKRRAS